MVSVTVWPEFQCQVKAAQSDPRLGVRVDLWGRKWHQSKSLPHIPIRLLCTVYAHTQFGHNTQRGRQTQRSEYAPSQFLPLGRADGNAFGVS